MPDLKHPCPRCGWPMIFRQQTNGEDAWECVATPDQHRIAELESALAKETEEAERHFQMVGRQGQEMIRRQVEIERLESALQAVTLENERLQNQIRSEAEGMTAIRQELEGAGIDMGSDEHGDTQDEVTAIGILGKRLSQAEIENELFRDQAENFYAIVYMDLRLLLGIGDPFGPRGDGRSVYDEVSGLITQLSASQAALQAVTLERDEACRLIIGADRNFQDLKHLHEEKKAEASALRAELEEAKDSRATMALQNASLLADLDVVCDERDELLRAVGAFKNGSPLTAAEALRYLAEHPRPVGGEELFNSAHCYQLARELEFGAKAIASTARLVPAQREGDEHE